MAITWSNWHKLNQTANYDGCAIYRIRACTPKATVSINRFLGIDRKGLLCIGKTTNMDVRRKQFVSGLGKMHGHSEGNLLYVLQKHTPLLKKYPGLECEYSFARIKSKGRESKLEENEIKVYVKKFGEVPPLNSAIPSRYGKWRDRP